MALPLPEYRTEQPDHGTEISFVLKTVYMREVKKLKQGQIKAGLVDADVFSDWWDQHQGDARVLLIDCRHSAEYDARTALNPIPHAVNFPLLNADAFSCENDLDTDDLIKRAPNKDRPLWAATAANVQAVVIYCQFCKTRSHNLAKWYVANFKDARPGQTVLLLRDGFSGWSKRQSEK